MDIVAYLLITLYEEVHHSFGELFILYYTHTTARIELYPVDDSAPPYVITTISTTRLYENENAKKSQLVKVDFDNCFQCVSMLPGLFLS